jgi:hypothetical protein
LIRRIDCVRLLSPPRPIEFLAHFLLRNNPETAAGAADDARPVEGDEEGKPAATGSGEDESKPAADETKAEA